MACSNSCFPPALISFFPPPSSSCAPDEQTPVLIAANVLHGGSAQATRRPADYPCWTCNLDFCICRRFLQYLPAPSPTGSLPPSRSLTSHISLPCHHVLSKMHPGQTQRQSRRRLPLQDGQPNGDGCIKFTKLVRALQSRRGDKQSQIRVTSVRAFFPFFPAIQQCSWALDCGFQRKLASTAKSFRVIMSFPVFRPHRR